MNCATGIRHHTTILLMAVFFLSACAGLAPRDIDRPSDLEVAGGPNTVRELISTLENQNFALKTFKGTGRISVRQNEKKAVTIRTAWVGATPDRLRVAIRDVSGMPVLSLASDGHWLYVFHHSQGQFYKKCAGNSIPKKLFPIPLTASEIVSLLAGRIPIAKHNSAILIKDPAFRNRLGRHSNWEPEPSNPIRTGGFKDGYILVLKKRWGNICEKIYLDSEKNEVRKVEMFDADGALAYRVEFIIVQDIKGYRVPSRLLISNDHGLGLQFEIDTYWVDVAVAPSMFVLASPKQHTH